MLINFLMPCYKWTPSGGFRVVYEYANRLVSRGHHVTVVHPRRLKFPPPRSESLTVRAWIRQTRLWMRELVSKPAIDWHPIDERVNLAFVPSSDAGNIPDGDVLFATGWHTVRSVLECPAEKGAKCYLIQGYETWLGPKELVDDTWRAPLRKVVIARWLLELGRTLGCCDLTYIPNAIDHRRYRITRPIEQRLQQVAMVFSFVPLKGARDGIEALEIAKRKFPGLRVSLFGNSRRASWIPKWMTYEENPPQDRIVQEFYNASSIFLSPSWMEGFPLPPAEAAACGCAIVATDIGGIRDYVQNDITGLLSPPKAPEALAKNLCLLLGNDELRIRLARAANASIRGFNWEQSTDQMEKFMMG
jgi:glycosyltransferase involved in cell wall biosynthesis